MTILKEFQYLGALRTGARHLVTRYLLKAAIINMTATVRLYRAGLIDRAGAKIGMNFSDKLQRTAIRWLRSERSRRQH